MTPNNPTGYLTFVLHSHLPYVLNHGTWPHGEDWLYEAAAETYLPLLRVFKDLEQRGRALKANVNLSPILLEQLNHPRFKEGFAEYLSVKIEAADKDEKQFSAKGETHFARVAHFWRDFFRLALAQFRELHGDIIKGFKYYYDRGDIEIITCGATHGYFALLGTDAAIRAQVRLAVETHKRYFGRHPRGIWLPECSYRPAGEWKYPVTWDGGLQRPFLRYGVEQILAENNIEFFFVDTHLVDKRVTFAPYEWLAGDVPVAAELESEDCASLYTPYFADTPDRRRARVAFFTRDPRTGVQVWSGDHGYPGDPVYLDFHKKHWPGGHRYWQVTHPKVDLGLKTAYFPDLARERTRSHAQHFSEVTTSVLTQHAHAREDNGAPPILTAPFDSELFGHWWFEGPEWLRNVALEYANPGHSMKLITCSEYLDRFGVPGFVELPEGSWGRNGGHEVWLNHATEWTWKHIYPAELAVQQMADSPKWRESEIGTRIAKQLCRELLLLESSDWQFLITTEHARDYAEKRFQTHLDQFRTVLDAWRRFESTGDLQPELVDEVKKIEQRDSVFPDITPDIFQPEPAGIETNS